MADPVTRSLVRRSTRSRAARQRARREGVELPDPRSNVRKIIDIWNTPLYGTVGAVDELLDRSRDQAGNIPVPITRAITRGIKERRTFSELTGDPTSGLILDVVLDPANIVPFSAVGKTIKVAGKALRVQKAVAKADKFADSVKQIRETRRAFRKFFSPVADLKKHNPDFELAKRNRYLQKTYGEAARLAEEARTEMHRLVPNDQKKMEIFDLIEIEQTDDLMNAVGKADLERAADFRLRFAALAKNEKLAYERYKEILSNLLNVKMEFRRVTMDRAKDLLKKAGVNYTPWRFGRKEHVLQRLKEIRNALKKGDPTVTSKGRLKEIEETIKELDEIDEVFGFDDLVRIGRAARGQAGFQPEFTKARTLRGPRSELPTRALAAINTDIAKLAGLETARAFQLRAADRYLTDLSKYLKKKNLLLPREIAEDPVKAANIIKKTLGTGDEAARRVREGFRPLKSPGRLPETIKKEFEGMVVPTSMADEIDRVVRAYSDPTYMEALFKNLAKVQNLWKAWTLAPIPSYHLRNFLSNIWNNSLAGMDILQDPTVIQDYWAAFRLLIKHRIARRKGKKLADDMMYPKQKLTEAGVMRASEDLRVINAGETVGELYQGVNNALQPRSWFNRTLGQQNPVIRGGYAGGRFIEDHSRLSHFLWRLRKGDSPTKAAGSVQKFLFDYVLGLSPSESKWFRNFLIPFYAWTRFNLPLQLEYLVRAPRKFARFGKYLNYAEDQFGGPEPNEQFLSQWMQDALTLRIRYSPKDRVYQYFVMNSWWPGSDLLKATSLREFVDEMKNMTSPFLKVGPELAFNYNLFSGQPLARPGQKEKFLGLDLDGRIKHLLRFSRPLNEIDKTMATINESGWTAGVLRSMFGRVYPVDFEKQKKWWMFEYRKRIREAKKDIRFHERAIERGEARAVPENIPRLERRIEELNALLEELERMPASPKQQRQTPRLRLRR